MCYIEASIAASLRCTGKQSWQQHQLSVHNYYITEIRSEKQEGLLQPEFLHRNDILPAHALPDYLNHRATGRSTLPTLAEPGDPCIFIVRGG